MNEVWLTSYHQDVFEDVDVDKFSSLVAMFEQSVRQYANRVACINMGQVLTYKELDELSLAFAAYLQQKLKLEKGERIAIMMPNLLQYPVALLGILRAGLVVVNVNPLYTARELQDQLNDADVKAIIIVSNFAHILEQVIDKTSIEEVIISDIADMLRPVKRVVVNFIIKYVKKLVADYYLPNAHHWRNVIAEGKKLTLMAVDIYPDDIAILQYTGGTTGFAKGAMLTNRNVLANVEQVYAAFSPILSDDKNELIVTALPLYHIFALTLNGFLMFRIGATSLLITNPKDIKRMVKTISRYPFTVITGVNTLFNSLLNQPEFAKLNFEHLLLSVAGGMAVHHSVAEKWFSVTGNHLLEGYGLTECSPIVSANPCHLEKYSGSIGLPLPSTNIRIINDNSKQVAIGEPGELLVKGPQVMKGYWKRPKETDEILQDGWLYTGDIVTIDEQGYLRLVDRKKDMIIVSGFNVYPNEIEQVLSLNKRIVESAVVGINDKKTGEKVIACIVKKDPKLTEAEVMKFCRRSLTAYKVPRKIIFLDQLPKSNVGKILRKELRIALNEP